MFFQAPEPPHHWWWLFPTITGVGGLVGGALGSLFSKWGEITAIQTRIDTVVEQSGRIVESTETIKKELLEETWAKQRRWELKRDTALDLMRVFGEIQQLVNTIFHDLRPGESQEDIKNIFEAQGQAAAVDAVQRRVEEQKRLANEYLLSMRKFWQVKGTIGMVFSKEIPELMNRVQNALAHLISLLGQQNPPFTDAEKTLRINNLAEQKDLLTKAIRDELKI